MSTFKGIVAEFPDIRIDFFRRNASTRPPLACFLSHVHSDHLAGLDTLKSPFIYCSPATREILLRLEKYPHRMNFALKILESRKLTYKHLDKILKPIPLETPTKIELAPGNVITVTLFDANHCPGAVMFLIENNDKSILYTGDIRSEPSFVSSLRRNPNLIEYTHDIKTLDCIYLDTSNTENISFPSKSDGLAELLQEVSKYPSDTVFHISAWTYGYEEVWMALAKTLKSQIHVDRYKMRIYKSLVGANDINSVTGPFISYEGPILAGYQCGNTKQDGCLTENPDVRVHSCEKGLHCPVVSNNTSVVWITPIVTRTRDGEDVEEAGIGGGGGDLVQRPELELGSADDVEKFLSLLEGLDHDAEKMLRQRLLAVLSSSRMAISLDDLGLSGLDRDQNEMSLTNFAELISKSTSSLKNAALKRSFGPKYSLELPRKITFPYSRHSSFPELCDLVAAFKPRDVYPCTVDEAEWHEGISIKAQFGRHCVDTKFRHDLEMRQLQAQKATRAASMQTHTTESSEESVADPFVVSEQVHMLGELGRDSQGRIRLFKCGVKQTEGTSTSTAKHKPPPQLPHEIISSSPGSQSQNLRRKLILQDLHEVRRAKRARITQSDGPSSSPLASRRIEWLEQAGFDSSADSSEGEPGTPGSDGEEIEEQLAYLRNSTFYDRDDNVQRCKMCENELESLMGHCGYCDDEFKQPYYEVIDPEKGPRPEIAFDEYNDQMMDEDDRFQYVGDYLDDDPASYDSQDGEEGFREEYEVDSFINDKSEASGGSEDETDSDEEPDWEQKFKDLEKEHEAVDTNRKILAGALAETEDRYYTLLDEMGIPHSDNDDEDELDEELDEDGNVLVNQPALVPAVHELVLSVAPESTGHNHAEAEIEL